MNRRNPAPAGFFVAYELATVARAALRGLPGRSQPAMPGQSWRWGGHGKHRQPTQPKLRLPRAGVWRRWRDRCSGVSARRLLWRTGWKDSRLDYQGLAVMRAFVLLASSGDAPGQRREAWPPASSGDDAPIAGFARPHSQKPAACGLCCIWRLPCMTPQRGVPAA